MDSVTPRFLTVALYQFVDLPDCATLRAPLQTLCDERGVRGVLAHKNIVMGVFVGLLGLTWGLFQLVPKGFIPTQDKQYLVGLVQLPNAASLNRTDEVTRRVGDIALSIPGVRATVQFPGLSIAGFTNSPNSAIVFFGLDDFENRKSKETYGLNIANQLNAKLSSI